MSAGAEAPGGRWSARFGQVEIPAADPAAAAGFYRRAFGWRSEPESGAEPAYWKLRPARGPGGGVTTAAALGGDRPLVVIHVDPATGDDDDRDRGETLLDDCLERIVAAGGSIDLPPRRVADSGWFARFRDPGGNLLGLWAAAPGGG